MRIRSDKGASSLVLLMALALAASSGYAQQTAETVDVKLAMSQASYKAADTQLLTFSIKNQTADDLSVLNWFTPFAGMNADIFRVEKEGRVVAYTGRTVKRGPFTADDFMTLRPGETKQVEVNLPANYHIRDAGDYTVTFVGYLVSGRESSERLARKAQEEFAPPPATVTTFKLLEPRRAQPGPTPEVGGAPPSQAAQKVLSGFSGCSSAREGELIVARLRAEELARGAKAAVAGLPEGQRPSAARYSEWFGAYDAGRYATVAQHYQAIEDAVSTKPVTFDCSCTNNYYAYVYATQPYKIYLCNAFWSAPVLGTDSRAGTLIHEISHFNVVSATDDHVYGQSGSRNLASTDPGKAIQNADSHEYFAENTPPTAMGTSTTMLASLAASNGKYVVAEGGGGGAVNANRAEARAWETLTLVDINGGSLTSGDTVNLGTHDAKHFVVAEGGGGREVKADRAWPRSWETFVMRKVSGSGQISFGDNVSLQAANGQYVVAEGGGGGKVNANRNAVGAWETFGLYAPAASNSVLANLKAKNGQYLVAEGGGGGSVNANRAEAREWETFTLVDLNGGALASGDSVVLRAFDEVHYVVAEGGGGREVKGDRTWARTWETFTLRKVGGSGEIRPGDPVSLQASNGQYVVAEGGGGGAVNANRNAVGAWETFNMVFVAR